MTLAKMEKSNVQSASENKKQALISVLATLQLEDIVTKIKEMRLKKKLIG